MRLPCSFPASSLAPGTGEGHPGPRLQGGGGKVQGPTMSIKDGADKFHPQVLFFFFN